MKPDMIDRSNALGVGRWALGVGRWALGVGRWALGVGLRASCFSPTSDTRGQLGSQLYLVNWGQVYL